MTALTPHWKGKMLAKDIKSTKTYDWDVKPLLYHKLFRINRKIVPWTGSTQKIQKWCVFICKTVWNLEIIDLLIANSIKWKFLTVILYSDTVLHTHHSILKAKKLQALNALHLVGFVKHLVTEKWRKKLIHTSFAFFSTNSLSWI